MNELPGEDAPFSLGLTTQGVTCAAVQAVSITHPHYKKSSTSFGRLYRAVRHALVLGVHPYSTGWPVSHVMDSFPKKVQIPTSNGRRSQETQAGNLTQLKLDTANQA